MITPEPEFVHPLPTPATMQRLLQKTCALVAIAALPLTNLLWATPGEASSRYRREFDAEGFHRCATELLAVEVNESQTQTACAMALEPTDLSSCVVQIDTLTVVDETEALFSCFRVRRPLELASCMVDIDEELLEPRGLAQSSYRQLSSNTLDHCRRSLLPLRFSACVRGLSREVDFTAFEPWEALDVCIDAEDFPRDIYTPATNSTNLPANDAQSRP